MAKKTFFDERTEAQIRSLAVQPVSFSRNLIDRILDLDVYSQALELRFPILPGEFYAGGNNAVQAARKAYKHGTYLNLSQARTIEEALRDKRMPHQIRADDFKTRLSSKNPDEIQVQGYSFRPIQGNDKRKRLVPFVWIMEGARLFAYAVAQTEDGIKVMPYDDAQRVELEGASVPVTVPAREDKKPRYLIRAENVPVVNSPEANAIWPGFITTYAEGKVPEHKFWSFGYKFRDDKESSSNVIMYPHDIAAMLGVARYFMTEEENPTPWNYNPFAKPSLKDARFYRKLCNNVIVKDPGVNNKTHTRKLYVPEKSILMARFLGKVGPEESMFWKKGRDLKLQDYDWSIPSK